MPLFRMNTVVFQPILYMFTKCMLCMEESIGIMEKWIEPMANSMKTMEKSMSAVWVNQSAPWKTWWTVQMANFRSQIQQSRAFCSKMQQIARKSAPDWKTQKNKKNKNKSKKICTPSKCASRRNAVHFSTSQLPKVLWRWCVLYILTWKCPPRHNSMYFFHITTLKVLRTCGVSSILTLKSVSHHTTSQFPKAFEVGVFCTFWLENVRRALFSHHSF